MKTALIFGATGLIGSELIRRIVNDAHYRDLKIFVRRNIRIRNLHTEVFPIDFEKLEEYAHLFTGDDCFYCIGTTIRKAKSNEKFRQVDVDLAVKIAQLTSQQGVKRFIAVSSLGANASSSNFYLHTKGEMEQAIQHISFEQVSFVRPSMLIGRRKDFRLFERIGILFGRILSPLMLGPLRKYRPIHVKYVAKAMLRVANSKTPQTIYESDELRRLGGV